MLSSDGYIDRASSDLKSFYLSTAFVNENNSLRLNVFSGKEKTYQAWNGVPEAKLKGYDQALVTHYYNNLGYLYNSKEDIINLFESDKRTYNVFTYKNQTDNYQQDYYQLHYSLSAGKHTMLNAALHYTKGRGYYEEYKYNQSLSDYGLNDVIVTRIAVSDQVIQVVNFIETCVEIHNIKGLPHADGMLIAYIPSARLVAYADMGHCEVASPADSCTESLIICIQSCSKAPETGAEPRYDDITRDSRRKPAISRT